ncbi:MAG: PA2817 family protein [Marinobacterium sp.]
MTDRHSFHLNLLKIAYNNLIQQPTFKDAEASEELEFLDQFSAVVDDFEHHRPEAYEDGQTLLVRLVRGYPQFVPLLARDLFWLFGGECLHFMSDEEIEQFQQLDETQAELEASNNPVDYLSLRQSILGDASDTRH